MSKAIDLCRLRLIYLRKHYPMEFGIENISRFSKIIRRDLSDAELQELASNPVTQLSDDPLTTREDKVVRNFFKETGASIWSEIPGISRVLGIQVCDRREWPEERLGPTVDKIIKFLRYGAPGPSTILGEKLSAIGTELTIEHLLPRLEEPEGLSLLKNPGRLFLRGYWPIDPSEQWVVARDVAIETETEKRLLESIERHRLVLFTSAAGDGKTAAMLRAAIKLRNSGERVIFCQSPAYGRPFPSLPASGQRTFIFVDNADSASSYRRLLDSLNNGNYRILLAARHFQWAQRSYESLSGAVGISPSPLEAGEMERLAAQIIQYHAAETGAKKAALTAQLADTLGQTTDNHLLAAMMTATHGSGFRTVVKNAVTQIASTEHAQAMRYVTCSEFVSKLTSYETPPIPVWALRLLLAKFLGLRISNSRLGAQSRRAVSTYLEGLGGEARIVRTGRVAYYMLRHPVVEEVAFEHFYGPTDGETEVPSHIDDLYDELADIVEVSIRHAGGHPEDFVPSSNYSMSWLKSLEKISETASTVIQMDITNTLFRETIRVLGYWSNQKTQTAHLFRRWLQFATRHQNIGNQDGTDEYSARWIFRAAVESGCVDDMLDNQFLRLESSRNLGDPDEPDPFSFRGRCRELWHNGQRGSRFLSFWLFCEGKSNVGDTKEPKEFTARWIGQSVWNEDLRAELVLNAWFRIELVDNLGTIAEPEEFTARWLARTIWNEGLRQDPILDGWIDVESTENLGSIDDPRKYSARWIARSIWKENLRPEAVLNTWFRIESAQNLGSESDPAMYSARWVARSLWEEGLRQESFLDGWLGIESERYIGSVSAPQKYSARWLARSVWHEDLRLEGIIDLWIKMESTDNLGSDDDPQEYSARWIARSVWKENLRFENVLKRWIVIESAQNSGSITEPKMYTARWIARSVWNEHLRPESVLNTWFTIESTNNLGSLSNPKEYSGRWLARAAWDEGLRQESLIIKWFDIEITGNLGTISNPDKYTARWLARSLWDEGIRAEAVILTWLEVEAAENPGSISSPEEYSARRLMRSLWKEGRCTPKLQRWWLCMEAEQNTGSSNGPEKYSARWIADNIGSDSRKILDAWIDKQTKAAGAVTTTFEDFYLEELQQTRSNC